LPDRPHAYRELASFGDPGFSTISAGAAIERATPTSGGAAVMVYQRVRDHDIAIIAMTGRFPGANNVPEFWENLKGGVHSLEEFTEDELAPFVPRALREHPDYVKARPVLDNVRGFDAGLFGFSPREAEMADPQQRIFLECVWETLEQAGYGRAGSRGRVGVFAGTNLSTYLNDRFFDPKVMMTIDHFEMVIGNDKDALPTVAAYRLDLTGPAVAVQTFCSTSAVAVHLACQSLRDGACDSAIAGGVCIRVPDKTGHLYVPGGQLSPDGMVRTFDANAQGGIFGDGAGVVLLKPLRKALDDRDTVLAVIRGSGMNNDGAAKFSYTAPSVVGQAAAISAALDDAEVAPRDISYVEAHGTATEMGDPIEIAALTRAFREAEQRRGGEELRDRQYCAVGSVKTNVGHLDRAASVTGMIKVVEALRNGLVPKSLNYETPNPEIDFARSPFFVAKDPMPWPRQPGKPRIAGLNGLGMGGTNVHIVLQEAPEQPARPPSPRRWQVLPVSGRITNAATAYCENMARFLADDTGHELADIAYTLQTGRSLFAHRRVCVANSSSDAAAAFAGERNSNSQLLVRNDNTRSRQAGFLFAGVGEHYPGMVADLYRHEPTFRRHLDHGQRLLAEHHQLDVVSLLTGERDSGAAAADLAALMGRGNDGARQGPLSDTTVAQPAVFLAEYALASTLIDWGVKPSLVMGFSVGEYVAACLAGVLTLEDAVRLVAHRAQLIGTLPAGSMLAVGLTWDKLNSLVPDLGESNIDLSALTPGQVVVGGPPDEIADLAERLRDAQVVCRGLDTTHAFHTRMLEPVAEELTRWVADEITVRPPVIPYISNVTGQEVTAELVTDPGYWSRHMCQPVQFTEGLATALRIKDLGLIELGPGRTLGAMARSHPDCDRDRWPLIVPTLPAASEAVTDDRTVAGCLAELWLTGVDVDWETYHRTDEVWQPGLIPVPTYPFQHEDYWFNEEWSWMAGVSSMASSDKSREEIASEYEKLPLLPENEWLNLRVWKECAPRPRVVNDGQTWLVFTDDDQGAQISDPLRTTLQSEDRHVILVRPGESFAEDADGFRIRIGNTADILELFTALRKQGSLPQRIVHLWTLAQTDETASTGDTASTDQTVRAGMHTLVAIARAHHEVGLGEWQLDVVTAGAYQVDRDDPIVPERATVLGPCTILTAECPGTTIRVLDLRHGDPLPVEQVLAELRTDPGNQNVAIRNGRRWTPDYDILRLAVEGEEPPEPQPPMRPGGVYMITGGLGGVGMGLAERLADDYQAKLVLLGRTPVPPPETWDAVLADPTASAEVRRRIEGLRTLRDKGSEVEVVAGDVANQGDVDRAVATAHERFGALHGVLHAAGVPGMGMMQFKTGDDMDRVLASKVSGTLALAHALQDQPLDFLVLFSSVAAATGALGQADYAAANAFMDAFAEGNPLPNTRVVSIGWGEWTWNGWEAGLAGYEPVLREFYTKHRERFGIDFDAGWQCLLRILERPEPYVVVSTQDFSEQFGGHRDYTITDIQTAARLGRGNKRHPRPELSTAYVAPQSPPEIAIAEIWADTLGVEQVGIFDNFFELGGNSLLGMGIVDSVKRELELEHLAAHVIYQASTVASLAEVAAPAETTPEADANGESATQPDDRAKARQKHLARRRASRREGAGDDRD
jgi:acyl transferase domain-containing protein